MSDAAAPAADRSRITQLLVRWRDGHVESRDELLEVMYHDLRRLANHYLSAERSGHTLQPTALVHELYLRLLNIDRVLWQDRAHFFAAAAQMMRRILVDYARMKLAGKRGGAVLTIALGDLDGACVVEQEMLTVDAALDQLAALDPRAARVVEARFFAGLKEDETAAVLGLSVATVKRDWQFARAWLGDRLRG